MFTAWISAFFHYFSSIITEGQHRTSVWVDSDTLFLLGDSDFHQFTWRFSVSECVCECVCLCMVVYTCRCSCGCACSWQKGWAEGFCSRHTVDSFFSAWQGRQTKRRDDGRVMRGSARPADAHLRMTLEFWGWRLSEIFRGHKEEVDRTCLSSHHADKWCGSCKVYFHVATSCNIQFCREKEAGRGTITINYSGNEFQMPLSKKKTIFLILLNFLIQRKRIICVILCEVDLRTVRTIFNTFKDKMLLDGRNNRIWFLDCNTNLFFFFIHANSVAQWISK